MIVPTPVIVAVGAVGLGEADVLPGPAAGGAIAGVGGVVFGGEAIDGKGETGGAAATATPGAGVAGLRLTGLLGAGGKLTAGGVDEMLVPGNPASPWPGGAAGVAFSREPAQGGASSDRSVALGPLLIAK
jgi:hypothetical protein